MTFLMLTTLIQILVFCAGSILLIYAGKQDVKTRNPFLLIPTLMAIGLSAGIQTFLFISLASVIIFFLPAKINKILGKADLLLFTSALMIIILNQNLLLTTIIFMSLALTVIIMLLDKNLSKAVPLIYYYAKGYALAILIIIGVGIGVFLGVML